MEEQAVVMVGAGPAEFRQVMLAEVERWRKVVRDNNIIAEQE